MVSRVSSTPKLKLDWVAAYRDGSGNEDALIDDVWIGSADLTGMIASSRIAFNNRC